MKSNTVRDISFALVLLLVAATSASVDVRSMNTITALQAKLAVQEGAASQHYEYLITQIELLRAELRSQQDGER